MITKPREVYHGKYFRHGGSYAVLIPPDVRDMMELLPGDSLIMACDEGILFMRKAVRTLVVNREAATRIFERLFAEGKSNNDRNK